MLQGERSERSRTAILDAALELFSHRGYGATSMRDIAGKAGVSPAASTIISRTRKSIFQALLEQFRAITQRPDFPINVALENGAFFDDFTRAGRRRARGAGASGARTWRSSTSTRWSSTAGTSSASTRDLAARFEQFAETNRERLQLDTRMRDDVPAAAALLFAVRVFIYYFSVETIFGVDRQFGPSTPARDAHHRRHPAARHAAPPAAAPARQTSPGGVRPSSRISCSTRWRRPSSQRPRPRSPSSRRALSLDRVGHAGRASPASRTTALRRSGTHRFDDPRTSPRPPAAATAGRRPAAPRGRCSAAAIASASRRVCDRPGDDVALAGPPCSIASMWARAVSSMWPQQ